MADLVLGANVVGWTADRDTSFAVLDAFVAAGGTRIDTADSYTWRAPGNSGGESETILGEWMAARGNRDTLHLATKVGSWPERPGLGGANVAAAARDSLRRLGTDRIDLYYAHRDDPDTAQEETLDAFDALVREGLVREIGASNFSAERLRSAREISERDGLAAFTAVQPHYNLMERDDVEAALVPLAESAGLALYPYYGLAKGFLTGKYRPDSPAPEGPRSEGASAYLDSRGRAVLAGLDEIAAGHEVPVPAVALAWLAAQPSVTAPIASARTPEQLAQLLPMRTLELTHDELRLLSYLSATS
ncbi:alcohol dehydrogenase [Pseudonocardia sp. EC080610-09]|uniref:aldo/keto reductase n=1 Tax=unclassified Pseudonocardia TaxID=2619320 RepID=UPI0007064F52|nr:MULTISPECIES: aldo/keto reductase [unclassified Pseudonocardia]ALL75515.1 alcohol dehydrogenase [Pseudonocardia sp. EC080610-09]ALL82541.1 alcohol dehydrogenase [Pseudonocardia sp. EC080619-01]